jgi:hypothetical protein
MNRLVLVVLALVLAACGATAGADDGGLATIEGAVDSGAEVTASEAIDPEVALLELAACMRESGFPDFPDPVVDSDGNIRLGFLGPAETGIDPRSDEFRAARESCGQTLEGLALGPGRAGQGFEDPEFQDLMLEFAACLREGGLEVDDPDFSSPAPGESGPGGRGLFGGAFDPTDPANQAIIQDCQEEVGFFGPGGGPGRPGEGG